MTQDPYQSLVRRLLVACNLDPEVLPGLHEDAIVAVVQHKVAEGDKRIEAAQHEVDRWREAAELERACCLKAEAERDRLIEACVIDKWKPESYHIGDGHWGFEWRYGGKSGFFNERQPAVDAVRKALERETR